MKKELYKDIIITSLEDWKHLAADNVMGLMSNICEEYALQGIKNTSFKGKTIYKKSGSKHYKIAKIEVNKEENGAISIKNYQLFLK